jgi:hypothetical protein
MGCDMGLRGKQLYDCTHWFCFLGVDIFGYDYPCLSIAQKSWATMVGLDFGSHWVGRCERFHLDLCGLLCSSWQRLLGTYEYISFTAISGKCLKWRSW